MRDGITLDDIQALKDAGVTFDYRHDVLRRQLAGDEEILDSFNTRRSIETFYDLNKKYDLFYNVENQSIQDPLDIEENTIYRVTDLEPLNSETIDGLQQWCSNTQDVTYNIIVVNKVPVIIQKTNYTTITKKIDNHFTVFAWGIDLRLIIPDGEYPTYIMRGYPLPKVMRKMKRQLEADRQFAIPTTSNRCNNWKELI